MPEVPDKSFSTEGHAGPGGSLFDAAKNPSSNFRAKEVLNRDLPDSSMVLRSSRPDGEDKGRVENRTVRVFDSKDKVYRDVLEDKIDWSRHSIDAETKDGGSGTNEPGRIENRERRENVLAKEDFVAAVKAVMYTSRELKDKETDSGTTKTEKQRRRTEKASSIQQLKNNGVDVDYLMGSSEIDEDDLQRGAKRAARRSMVKKVNSGISTGKIEEGQGVDEILDRMNINDEKMDEWGVEKVLVVDIPRPGVPDEPERPGGEGRENPPPRSEERTRRQEDPTWDLDRVTAEIKRANKIEEKGLRVSALREIARALNKSHADPELINLVGRAVTETSRGPEYTFTEDDRDQILNYCYDLVFNTEPKANNLNDIYRFLYGDSGFLKNHLQKAFDAKLPQELTETIEGLGLMNWIEVRNNAQNWTTLLLADDTTPNLINTGLFLSEDTEKFFGKTKNLMVPNNNGEMVVFPEVEIEISEAMRLLYRYFDNVADYTVMAKGPAEARAEFYKGLGLNRYVAEVAMGLLMSHLMLTEAGKTAGDPFIKLVVGHEKRMADYAISENKETFVRMAVQSATYEGYDLFENKKLGDSGKAVIGEVLQEIIPSRLLPTGLLEGGREELMNGTWLDWRVVDNSYTSVQRNQDVLSGRNVSKKANDTVTRTNLVKKSLQILNSINECVKPESDFATIQKLKGDLWGWLVAMKSVGWVNNNDELDKNFDVEVGYRKITRKTSDWASRVTMGVGKAFLFSHSEIDPANINKKPFKLDELLSNAEMFFDTKAMSGGDDLLLLQQRIDMTTFVKEVEGRINELSLSFGQGRQLARALLGWSKDWIAPQKLPKWFITGNVTLKEEYKVFLGSQINKTTWSRFWKSVSKKLKEG